MRIQNSLIQNFQVQIQYKQIKLKQIETQRWTYKLLKQLKDLDFKINIEPRKINDHIQPDTELATDSSDPSDTNSIYQKYTNYGTVANSDFEQAQELKALNVIDSSSSEYDLRQAAHPIVCILTFLFKLSAALLYLFMGLVVKNQTIAYIAIVLLVSVDFWVTKNVSGRLLVGLRWNNAFLEDGTEIWRYESHDSADASNRVDKAFFWTSVIGSVLFWTIMVIGDIFMLHIFWVTLSGLAFILAGFNFHSFYKCRGEHQRKMSQFQQELTKRGLNVVGMVMLNSKYRL